MARGCTTVLHHFRILRLSFYLYLGFQIWSSSSPNLGSWGSVYILRLFRGFTILGISSIKTTSFHPQSNGMIVRFHRSLKSFLQARLASSNWVAHLSLVMLGLRSSPKDEFGLSPAETGYGSNLSLPGEFLEHSELPLESFLCQVELGSLGFLLTSSTSCGSSTSASAST